MSHLASSRFLRKRDLAYRSLGTLRAQERRNKGLRVCARTSKMFRLRASGLESRVKPLAGRRHLGMVDSLISVAKLTYSDDKLDAARA